MDALDRLADQLARIDDATARMRVALRMMRLWETKDPERYKFWRESLNEAAKDLTVEGEQVRFENAPTPNWTTTGDET